MVEVRSPNRIAALAERVHDDPEMFAFDGFGVMLSAQQVEAWQAIGSPGPRMEHEKKIDWLSGGQRGGKTVLLALFHNFACLYKNGVDNTDRRFWDNYLYKTLAGAPTTELTLKLWQVMDELTKGASDAQYDRKARRSRGGAFLHLMKAGTAGQWPVVKFNNGARTDFRSTEGWAFRLEGDQWWFFTWDEWASQPDREIEFVLTDVLMGRSRDHDAKIVPAAWPKEATERHLISVIRKIEEGTAPDEQVVYISSEAAWFTNKNALEAERRKKSPAQWSRTVLGRPAGGASVEFKPDMVENMTIQAEFPAPPEPGYRYFTSWDLGLAHDETVGITWRIPNNGVTVDNKARIVNAYAVKGEQVSLDTVAFEVIREQGFYGGQSAVDASGLGGVAAVRQLRGMRPRPYAFVARSNDRIWGNMRLAAITNALDCLTWGRPDDPGDDDAFLWGLVESPRIVRLFDQLANFDRDAKDIPDDWAMSFMIGLWYIRRFWVVGGHGRVPRAFTPFKPIEDEVVRPRRRVYSLRRKPPVSTEG